MSDMLTFIKGVAKNPTKIGAISPSSPYLAERMVKAASLTNEHAIAELGAGTGSITKRIREEVPRAPLIALEPDPSLAAILRREVERIDVSERFAEDLPEVVAEWGHPKVDRVISGLPWAMWPAWVQEPIIDAIAASMAPDGRFVTFTYVTSQIVPAAARLRELLLRYFGEVHRSQIQWANLPPAFVYIADRPLVDPLSRRSTKKLPVRLMGVNDNTLQRILKELKDRDRRP